MQEFFVFAIAIAALIYLFIKFVAKRKSHNCDKCGSTDNEPQKP